MKIIHGPGRHLPPDLLTDEEEPEEMLENPPGQLGVLVETQVHPVFALRQRDVAGVASSELRARVAGGLVES